jgi:hypothetical protein
MLRKERLQTVTDLYAKLQIRTLSVHSETMITKSMSVLSAYLIVGTCALAVPKHHTRRNTSNNPPGLYTEAMFAIVGVGVAILGIALTLTWPSRRRWLCRPRHVPYTQPIIKSNAHELQRPLSYSREPHSHRAAAANRKLVARRPTR